MKHCPECHNQSRLDSVPSQNPGIAIVGNMNVGKSSLFSWLSKKDTVSMNFPGTTVSVAAGHVKSLNATLYDTPGIYSIFSANEDEKVSRDILLPQKAFKQIASILLVADAKNMKRSLAIALQYAEYDIPMLIDINMIDEADARGIKINFEKLSEVLGVDICSSIAPEGIGVRKLLVKLKSPRIAKKLVTYPEWINNFIDIIKKLCRNTDISPRVIGLLLLSGDRSIEEYLAQKFGPELVDELKDLAADYRKEDTETFRALLVNLYNKKADQIVKEIQEVEPPRRNPHLVTFGDWCTRLHTGVPIAIAVLILVYLFVGSFGATFLVDTINGVIFEGYLIPWTAKLLAPIPSPFFRDMFIDPDFGILPTGIFLALGLVMPVLFCFYLVFGILESSGYLPRLSILLDKVFRKMGLNGKGVIPLVMGFSCVTMAILTTRLLDTKKEKNIATFLLLLGMPCAPLIAVMLVILEKMPFSATLTVFGIIFVQTFIAGFVANKIIPGQGSPLIFEIPPIRLPKPVQVIKSAGQKTYFFIKEAVPVFIFASLFVFLFERAGGLEIAENIFRPITSSLMGLPEKSVQVFIKTIIRRESGATELEHLRGSYSNLQLIVNLLIMTFLTPCINAILVLFKERGRKTAALIICTVVVYAILMGSLINHICLALGVTFT
ncbi:MAG: ferrous iron transporter B [Deltaproteobacteria bacterium]|nr:ferrous iron transporter B [Deltaproteobacteria bacterium]